MDYIIILPLWYLYNVVHISLYKIYCLYYTMGYIISLLYPYIYILDI